MKTAPSPGKYPLKALVLQPSHKPGQQEAKVQQVCDVHEHLQHSQTKWYSKAGAGIQIAQPPFLQHSDSVSKHLQKSRPTSPSVQDTFWHSFRQGSHSAAG